MNASEDEDDPAEAQGSTLPPQTMPQTQPTAVVAELDTEEDLKDECEWFGHPEWFEAAKSNEAKKKGARRSRLQRIKKRCEDEARRRGSTRAAQIAIRRAAAAAPSCASQQVGASDTSDGFDALNDVSARLASAKLDGIVDSARHCTWRCRLDGLLELRQIGLLCVAGRSEHVQRLVVEPLPPSTSQASAADVTVILKVHASAARVSELVLRADWQPAEFDRTWWQQRERENRESSAGLFFDSSHQGATKDQVEARPIDEAAARAAHAAAVKERRGQEAETARAPFVERKALLQQLLLNAGLDRFTTLCATGELIPVDRCVFLQSAEDADLLMLDLPEWEWLEALEERLHLYILFKERDRERPEATRPLFNKKVFRVTLEGQLSQSTKWRSYFGETRLTEEETASRVLVYEQLYAADTWKLSPMDHPLMYGRLIANDGWQPCEGPFYGRPPKEWKWATDRIEDGAVDIALLGRPPLQGMQVNWMWPHQLAREVEKSYEIKRAETEEKRVRASHSTLNMGGESLASIQAVSLIPCACRCKCEPNS